MSDNIKVTFADKKDENLVTLKEGVRPFVPYLDSDNVVRIFTNDRDSIGNLIGLQWGADKLSARSSYSLPYRRVNIEIIVSEIE